MDVHAVKADEVHEYRTFKYSNKTLNVRFFVIEHTSSMKSVMVFHPLRVWNTTDLDIRSVG